MPRKLKLVEAALDTASDVAKRKKKAKRAHIEKLSNLFRPIRRADSNVTEVIHTGLEVVDRYVLGIGGWPAKRVIEVFGAYGSCKTSIGFSAIAGAQRQGGIGILVESEDALQVERATVFGVGLDDIVFSQPLTWEEAITAQREVLTKLPKDVGPNVMVWDSLAMSTVKDILENGLKAKGMNRKSQLMGAQWPAVVKLCKQKRVAMLIINQSRTKIGVAFGNPTTTPGGETHKFTASTRIQLWPGGVAKHKGEPVGTHCTIKAEKHKLGIPLKKAKLRLLYEHGWDDHWTTLNHAKDRKVIEKDAKLTEANYHRARAELGWEGEGTPWVRPLDDSVVEEEEGLVADEEDPEYTR